MFFREQLGFLSATMKHPNTCTNIYEKEEPNSEITEWNSFSQLESFSPVIDLETNISDKKSSSGYSPICYTEEKSTTCPTPVLETSCRSSGNSTKFSTKDLKRSGKDPVEMAILTKLEQLDNQEEDEEAIFGRLVASAIRKLSPRGKLRARQRVHNILIDMEMDELQTSRFPTAEDELQVRFGSDSHSTSSFSTGILSKIIMNILNSYIFMGVKQQ